MMVPATTSLNFNLPSVWTSLSMCPFSLRNLTEMERLWTFVKGVWMSQVQWVWSVHGACGERRQVQAGGLHLSGKLGSSHWYSTSVSDI